GVAGASTINVSWTIQGPYSCLGPCSSATFFNVNGVAHSDSKVLGTMTYVGQGTVTGVLDNGCLTQTENWAFTLQNGHNGKDTIDLSTVGDTFCPTANPNVFSETADFTITGGTGQFSSASGGGSFALTVLGHPQTGSGTF